MFKKLFSAIAVVLFLFGCVQQAEKPGLPRDLEIIISPKGTVSQGKVTLLLYALNAKECRFSNDNEDWSAWESYNREKQWVLSGGDGTKQVFYQCRNSDGNVSAAVAATVILDSTAPALEIASPEEEWQYADKFSLVFTATDGVAPTLDCSAHFDNRSINLGVVTSGRQQSVTVHAAEGMYNLMLQCSDGLYTTARNVTFSLIRKPVVSLLIDGGSGYTSKIAVNLDVKSTTAAECRFSRKADEWGGWLQYKEMFEWNLTSGDGTKVVYTQCRDSKGTVSDTVSDFIVLDTSPPPYISIQVNNGDIWTNSRNVTLGLYAFAADKCRYSNDETAWSAWEPYKIKKAWTLSEGEGEKEVFYNCRKKDGEDIGTVSSKIKYSIVPKAAPSKLSIKIDAGGAYTSTEMIALDLYAVAASQCRFREGDLNWTAWEDYMAKRSFVLSRKDGAKTIYYQCRNDYGSSTVFSRIYLDQTPPGEVAGLNAQVTPFAVHLTWDAAKDAGSGVKMYIVLRKDENGIKEWAGITDELNFKDERVAPGENYEYSVQAVDNLNNFGKEHGFLNITVPERD